jgi:hypothetical protein
MFLNMINLLHFNFGAFVFVFDVALLGYFKRGIWRISVKIKELVYSSRSVVAVEVQKEDGGVFFYKCNGVYTIR